jgi:hypothetical protein
VDDFQVDTSAIKASLGVVDGTDDGITYRELQARRDMIRRRLESRR